MSVFDLTVAITVHSETVLAGPTMQSAEAAIDLAINSGISIERLMGLDTPSDGCRNYFSQPAFAAWKKVEFALRDQGRVRNKLVKIANGRWVAFLDGDDLFSENWLLLASKRLKEAESKGHRVIVHPELNWGFDSKSFVLIKTPQSDQLFTSNYFAIANYYDALCLAPREAYLDFPYANRDILSGFAYEDWQWNIETMAAGWHHVIVMDTIIFKRRREQSQTIESSRRQAVIRNLDCMAVDRIQNLGDVYV